VGPDFGNLGRTDLTLATRFTATAAAIGLLSGALATVAAGAAKATSTQVVTAPSGAVPFSVAEGADPRTAPRPVVPTAMPVRLVVVADPAVLGDPPVVLTQAAYPATGTTAAANPAPAWQAPRQSSNSPPPFHKTARKARSLPETGVPLSATLGAVTALTALLAGVGTVVAAGRRPDHER
jgi:hypothetical protein